MARNATSKNPRRTKKAARSSGPKKTNVRGAMASRRSTNPRKKK